MRLQHLQKRIRRNLVWCLVGFVLVQLGLAVALETCWSRQRDPDYDDLQRIVLERQALAPGRPLVLVLGSSRTQLALRAEQLNNSSDENAPVVVNCAVCGGGPMMHQVVLRRLVRAGVRPRLVFMEMMPLHLSAREGTPIEERQKWSGRYTLSEMAYLWGYCAEPQRLLTPWIWARLLPCDRHQAELRYLMRIDLARVQRKYSSGRDDWGWSACDRTFTPTEVERLTRESLVEYAAALRQPAQAPGAVKAARDVVKFALAQGIEVVLIAPPEGSAFRTYAPAVAESQMNAVRKLAQDLDVPLVDARTWIDDDGFYDGHHAIEKGANQYTQRFNREALGAFLHPRPERTAAAIARGVNSLR